MYFSNVNFPNMVFLCSQVKGPVAADNARNTSSLVGLHPRQLPWAPHLLHYDASTTIILKPSSSLDDHLCWLLTALFVCFNCHHPSSLMSPQLVCFPHLTILQHRRQNFGWLLAFVCARQTWPDEFCLYRKNLIKWVLSVHDKLDQMRWLLVETSLCASLY